MMQYYFRCCKWYTKQLNHSSPDKIQGEAQSQWGLWGGKKRKKRICCIPPSGLRGSPWDRWRLETFRLSSIFSVQHFSRPAVSGSGVFRSEYRFLPCWRWNPRHFLWRRPPGTADWANSGLKRIHLRRFGGTRETKLCGDRRVPPSWLLDIFSLCVVEI